jgi:hypothetical protein
LVTPFLIGSCLGIDEGLIVVTTDLNTGGRGLKFLFNEFVVVCMLLVVPIGSTEDRSVGPVRKAFMGFF